MRILSIDWDLPHLCSVCAKVTHSHVEVEQLDRLTWAQASETTPDANQLAQWFMESVSFNPSDFDALYFVIARDRVAVRKFEVPPLPIGELPDIVSMQIASQVTSRIDELIVDFIAIPQLTPDGMQEVIASTIPKKIIQLLQDFSQAIGCPLQSVLISSLALAEVLCDSSQKSKDQTSIGVAAGQSRIETVLTHESQFLAGSVRRRFSEDAVSDQELTAEIKRMLLSKTTENANQESPRNINSFIQIPEIKDNTESIVSNKLSWETMTPKVITKKLNEQQQESLSSVEAQAAIGAVVSHLNKSHPQINFASPRQQMKPFDRKKFYSIAGAISAVVLIGVSFWLWRSEISSLEDKLNTVSDQLAATDKFIRDQKSTSNESQELQEYLEHRLDVSQHFTDVMTAMPDRKVLVFTNYKSVPLNGKTHTRINSSGLAVSRQDIQRFSAKLAAMGYLVRPGNIQVVQEREPYQLEFDLEFEIPIEVPVKTPGKASGS
ncbi:MAG: hypothetical protein JKY95_03420 [Planctomycetaceae bacterium]|nr:hypothetical protein [Planctomycetaceae bacterium]